ncbi:MAG: fimbrillin family protein [Dysgonamonadaceae bacterium]|nr:fimbrillin family protein [Dysgonamonadaceae bacterium]
MMKFKRLTSIVMIFVSLLFTACEQKELFPCPPAGNIPVNVMIHWDSVPANPLVLPNNMTVHWYPSKGSLLASDMGVYGGREWLSADQYKTICLDFNGNTNLAFRSNGTREDFEVYNIRMTGSYNSLVPPLPGGEITVAEAYPYRFYIDRRPQTVTTENVPAGDTVTVHFYPKNVLREFTFLVYDVIGARRMTRNGGAISGMSGSYFPADNQLATYPSTILFQRVDTVKNGQTSPRWTDEQKRLFARKDPNWANPDTLVGWTRDWVTGQFVTFGPLDRQNHRFRLTVEAVSESNNHYHGSWGYWHGEWENTVAAQIDSAMGKNGTLEEQLAWRQRNGGYDIILYNDRRLVIPDVEITPGGIPDGGFIVNVSDWGDIIDVPVAGSSPSPAPQPSSPLKSLVNTYATIPEFVVNGVWTGGNLPWYPIFNEQHVYKPEVGAGQIWDYAPKKYWPSSGEVMFYAYAPGGLPSSNLMRGLRDNGDDQNVPVIEYALSQTEREEPPPGTGEPPSPKVVSDKQHDLLVAVQHRTSPQNTPVPMNFRHAFSRVGIKAKSVASGYRLKLTRVDLRGLNTHGKLALAPDNNNLTYSTGIPMETGDPFKYNGTVTLWTDLDSLSDYRFRLIAPIVTVDNVYTSLLRSDDRVFVLPQTLTASAAIYVEYDVYERVGIWSDEVYKESVFRQFTLPPGFTFEIGRQYELLLTLDY